MTPRACCLAYLRAYAARDLAAVEALLADDVHLRDWNIAVQGKAAALAETRANFAAANAIDIAVLGLHESPGSVAAELRIVVDQHTELYVVDVLDFNAEGKISAIRAFLGRSPH